MTIKTVAASYGVSAPRPRMDLQMLALFPSPAWGDSWRAFARAQAKAPEEESRGEGSAKSSDSVKIVSVATER